MHPRPLPHHQLPHPLSNQTHQPVTATCLVVEKTTCLGHSARGLGATGGHNGGRHFRAAHLLLGSHLGREGGRAGQRGTKERKQSWQLEGPGGRTAEEGARWLGRPTQRSTRRQHPPTAHPSAPHLLQRRLKGLEADALGALGLDGREDQVRVCETRNQ